MPYKDPTSEAAKASNKRRQAKYNATEKSKKRFERYRENHPELRRENWYKGQYGVSLEAFEAQIAAQNNLCPIGNHPFGSRGKGKTSPCQDHDHESGENRLILCREHNVGLGQFHDSIPELESAILYLISFKKEKENDNVQRFDNSTADHRDSATDAGPSDSSGDQYNGNCVPTEQ